MSSQFNRSYHVTSSTVLSAELWNSVFQNIDLRLIGVEEKKASFEQAEQHLLGIGLRRINETIGPTAEKIMNLSELGFMVASSEEMIKPIDGEVLSVHLIKGKQAELFAPSPFVALVRRSTPDAYAIGRLLHYDRQLERVDMKIVSVQGVTQAYDDWDIAALAGSVKAMWDALDESRQIRDDVTAKYNDIQAKAADVVAKHGAVATSHADFISIWFGARNTPPDNAKAGAMYLDISQDPAVVMVKNTEGWIMAALASDNVYTKSQADDKFLTQDNAQFLPLSGGTVSGDLTVTGDVNSSHIDTKIAAAIADIPIGATFHTIEILTSGTINWPDWVTDNTLVHVMAWGGGGAGGWGGGGGGGECFVGWLKKGELGSDDVIIGAGGEKYPNSSSGQGGGDTHVGTLIVAQGGFGSGSYGETGSKGGGGTGGGGNVSVSQYVFKGEHSTYGGGGGGGIRGDGGNSVYGGGGGGGDGRSEAGGFGGKSTFGGDGGDQGEDGKIPGGGSGGAKNQIYGKGAQGKVVLRILK